MDKFIDWATGNAPWLLPLLFVLALTFLIVPAAARNGYERIIGYNPRFATERDETVPADTPGVYQFGRKFVAPASFKDRDEAPRLTLWAETLGAALRGGSSQLLTTLLLASLAVTAAIMHRLGGRPLYLPPKILPAAFALGCIGFLLLFFGGLRAVYTAPLVINDIGERLVTPREFQEISNGRDRDVTALYSWLHGVDPEEGRIDWKPDWAQLLHLQHYFDRLARYTLWSLWGLILLSSLAASSLRNGRLNTADYRAGLLAFLAVFTLLAHGTQWFWLAESYGRLRVGVAELRLRGELATRFSPTNFWPFLAPYNLGEPMTDLHESYDIKVQNIWPIPGQAADSVQVTTMFLAPCGVMEEVNQLAMLNLSRTKDNWSVIKVPKAKEDCMIQGFSIRDGVLDALPLVPFRYVGGGQ